MSLGFYKMKKHSSGSAMKEGFEKDVTYKYDSNGQRTKVVNVEKDKESNPYAQRA